MKLSEAILLGSTLSRQCGGAYEDLLGNRCALGSALAAVGKKIEGVEGNHEAPKLIRELWPHTDLAHYGSLQCGYNCPDPHCGAVAVTLARLIVHLNDQHYWTRERIAEHITQFDPAEPETTPLTVGRDPSHRVPLEVTEA